MEDRPSERLRPLGGAGVGAFLYPFYIILRETVFTSAGQRSYQRRIADAISCELGIFQWITFYRDWAHS